MHRSRLRNIINKSKEISNKKQVGDPFDEFKNSLPEELGYYKDNDKYRLKAAWEAYGKPSNFQDAKWLGMIESLDGQNFIMPSIGYNEETDEYEYLNKGEDNETVAKDIRVWDNDVIPLVKELKLGGYVRTFNKEKDCWTYSKNSQKKEELTLIDELQVNLFLKGGKSKRSRTDLILYANQSGIPFMQRILNNDLRKLDLHDGSYATHLLGYGEIDGKTYVYPEVQENEYKNLLYYKFPEALDRAIKNKDILEMTPEEAEWFTTNYKWFYPSYFGANPYPKSPQAFKEGGQMSVIPEGALHARKNNMEGAGEDFTAKGIPVVDNNGEQQAEIERDEIIYSKSATETIEKAYNEYSKEDTTESRKDELAIKIGKFLTKEILENTQDNTGLIEKVAEKNNLKYNK